MPMALNSSYHPPKKASKLIIIHYFFMCVQCISQSPMTKLTRKSIKVMTFQYSKVNYKFHMEFFSAGTGMQAHGNEKQLKGNICWCVQWSIQVVGFPACFCHLPSPVLLSPLLSSLLLLHWLPRGDRHFHVMSGGSDADQSWWKVLCPCLLT